MAMNNEPVAIVKLGGDVEWLTDVLPYNAKLYTHPAEPKELTVPENSQEWKGMDGATAFWLIERHSNHWDDAKLMMEEWLKANTHPAKTLTDEEILDIWYEFNNGSYDWTEFIKFAKAILRKAQGK